MNKLYVLLFTVLILHPCDALSWDKFDERQTLETKTQASLVFASENIKSPVSSFGHTFIVFHNQTPPEMSAVALEFVGDSTQPEFSYLRAGFMLVPGKFQLMPYYQKVRQYDLENRDTWLFPVNTKDIQSLKNAISQKLDKTYPYNFFTRNCSRYVAQFLLENIVPEAKVNGRITIPAQSVRQLLNLGVIKEGLYIKSQQKVMIEAYQDLPLAERKKVRIFTDNPENSKAQDIDPVLASAALTYQFKRERNGYKRDVIYRQKKTYNQTLLNSPEPKKFVESSAQLSIQGAEDGAAIVQFMPAHNSLQSYFPDVTSPHYLIVSSMQFYVKDSLRLQSLNLLKIDAAVPETPFSKGFTRYLDASYYDWKHLVNKEATETVLRYGFGSTKGLGSLTASVVPFFGVKYNHLENDDDVLAELGVKNKISLQAFGGKVDLQHMWLAYGGRAYKNKFKAEAVRPISNKTSLYLSFEATPDESFTSGGAMLKF